MIWKHVCIGQWVGGKVGTSMRTATMQAPIKVSVKCWCWEKNGGRREGRFFSSFGRVVDWHSLHIFKKRMMTIDQI